MFDRYTIPMVFRGMTPARDGAPSVGPTARSLGIRVPNDVQPDGRGRVAPRGGGMSVALASVWNLPNHRRPLGMGRGSSGPRTNHVFSLAKACIYSAALGVRPDPPDQLEHALVEPTAPISLAEFEIRLASTRLDWRRVWPR